jgi:Carboxypeptidase regulatory-like domain
MRWIATLTCIAALVAGLAAQQPPPSSQRQRPQQPARDTSAVPQDQAPAPTGRITGRVVAADSGRPIKRARVFINAAELPGGRGLLTDENGAFDFSELPGGRYTVNASKSGFVALSYGQRRPLQAGTPLQLGDGQQLKGVDFQLPRGSVIGGRITDEDGEPMAGVMVRVMRYQYLQGDRRLAPAGSGQTDDRGTYRVWGLMPGDYYVNAVARVSLPAGGRGGRGGPGAPAGFAGRGVAAAGPAAIVALGGANAAALFDSNDSDSVSYAPTYYPGVSTLTEAKAVTLGLSQELLDVNFGMQLVPMSRITGRVTNPDGSPVTGGNVNLMIDGSAGRGNQIGMTFGSRIQWDGAFTMINVPPGRYTLRARGDDGDVPQYASVPVTVGGADITDMAIVVTPGATISGIATFRSAATSPPDVTQFRITAPSSEPGFVGPQPNARLDRDGKFVLEGVPAGLHLIRPAGNMRGWTLQSVIAGGRDITDTPIELRSGEALGNVAVVLTDKINEINGTVTTDQGVPASEYTVLAFSTNTAFWRPQSRQIATTRPDQTGQYRIRTLPPGEYYVVAVDPAEQGEWFEPAYLDEHRAGAVRVTLSEGDVKAVDFKMRK